MVEDIEGQVAALARMDRAQLLARWEAEYGAPLHFRANVRLLRLALAYRIQEKAYGGLKPETRRKLREIAAAIREGRAPTLPPDRVKPGTRLVRSWGGETHSVTALKSGFEYRGKRYGSLSVIARDITGSRRSGPLFFGLKPYPKATRDQTDA